MKAGRMTMMVRVEKEVCGLVGEVTKRGRKLKGGELIVFIMKVILRLVEAVWGVRGYGVREKLEIIKWGVDETLRSVDPELSVIKRGGCGIDDEAISEIVDMVVSWKVGGK